MKLSLNFDFSFRLQFGISSLNKIRRIVAHAQAVFLWPSLSIPVKLDVKTEGYISKNFTADPNAM